MLTRRLSLLLSSLVCSSLTYAGEGFYIGAGASYNWLDYDFQADDEFVPSGPLINSEKSTAEGNQAGGQVLAGYTWLIPANNLYFFSIEAFADFYSIHGEKQWPVTLRNSNDRSITSTLRNAYGIGIKPGVFITNNLNAFVQASFVYSQLKDIVYDQAFTSQSAEQNKVNLDNENLYGFRFGVGAQYLLTKNLTTEVAWAMSFYNDFSKEAPSSFNQDGSVNSLVNIDFDSVRTSQIFLNLNYYFNG